ncbi:sulfotransferase [Luteimonas sp. MC1572]|uniref:tetratricopeptide repeat-containing sulfotransferase family protein n=1 Tax=Luteimonas sp. MC1572 TaxID=2799325 RepID=UPI0018F0C53C|nr:sulfotransferase [Luteimonas sp. MC1572]MBJ6981538.1 sulfotransferase [Luteimonas sp. MC1572]QQO02838.1 sulfotransferase [Luteimonas sp. MC1572]
MTPPASTDEGTSASAPVAAHAATDAWRQANAFAAAADWPAAADCYAGIAAAAPGDAAAWIGLAKARGRNGEYRAMHAAAMRAAAAGPRTWPHALALARLLRDLHETRALDALAADLVPRAHEAATDDMVALADLLGGEDLHRTALDWLDRANARDPAHAPAAYLRGSTRLFLGDMAGARDDLERAMARAPHFAHAHRRLSQLRATDRGGARARVDRLLAERAQVATGSEHDIHFSHALFDELHDLGEYADAWQALARGAAAKRASLRYDAADDAHLFEAIRAHGSRDFLAGPGHPGDADAPRPLFIVGMFRSGTTLLERMLGGHSAIAEGGESMGFAAALRHAVDHRARGVVDLETLRRSDDVDWPALGAAFMAGNAWRAQGRTWWTEKLPTNALLLGMVARALPDARFVHAWRPPMDVCFSNLRMLYGGFAPWSYDQRELATWHQGHTALMAHWRAVLGDRLLDVAHADLVRAPEHELRRVLAHCGLAFEPGVLQPQRDGGAVATASAAQVRDGIRTPREPDWSPYRAHLGPLAAGLGITLD